jgi:hypothetical protein
LRHPWGARECGHLDLWKQLPHVDYANAALFGQKVIDGGLGWQSYDGYFVYLTCTFSILPLNLNGALSK